MDSNVGALKNEIAQLRTLVADLRGKLGEVLTWQNDMERTFEERLNRHREDVTNSNFDHSDFTFMSRDS